MLLGCSLLAPRILPPSFPPSGPRARQLRLAGLPAQAAQAGTLALPAFSLPRDPRAGGRRGAALGGGATREAAYDIDGGQVVRVT
jgi:hypothetical protein